MSVLWFVAGFVAFPVCVSVLGLAVWRYDRKRMGAVDWPARERLPVEGSDVED